MGTLIIWNIVAIVAISLIVGLVVGTLGSERGEGLVTGGFASLWMGNLLLGLSITGWVIYVIAHFVQKFW